MKYNCNCRRLKFKFLTQGNGSSNRPIRKLLAKCIDCPRSYVCYATNMEVRFLGSGIKIATVAGSRINMSARAAVTSSYGHGGSSAGMAASL